MEPTTPRLNNQPLTEEESLSIRQENYMKAQNWDAFQSAMLEYASQNRIPYKGTFELTPRCSLKCKMCLMRLDSCDMAPQGRELTTEEWIRMGEMAFEAGTMDLLITGGEPLLRPDFAKIYTAYSDMGFILRLFTNGTLITPELINLFEERPPQSVELTVYGGSRETYERVGGWADGYDRMLAGLDALRAVVPSIKLKSTIIRDNAMDFEAMTELARVRGLPLTTTTVPSPAIRGAKADVHACRLNLRELIAFHAKHNLGLLNDGCAPPDPDTRQSIYCNAGLSSYSVLWHGAMVACMTDNDPNCVKGYPLEEGFANAWDKLADFRCNKPLPEPCKTCPIYATCSTCAVHHHTETGSYDKQARYCCDFYRIQSGLPLIDLKPGK